MLAAALERGMNVSGLIRSVILHDHFMMAGKSDDALRSESGENDRTYAPVVHPRPARMTQAERDAILRRVNKGG